MSSATDSFTTDRVRMLWLMIGLKTACNCKLKSCSTPVITIRHPPFANPQSPNPVPCVHQSFPDPNPEVFMSDPLPTISSRFISPRATQWRHAVHHSRNVLYETSRLVAEVDCWQLADEAWRFAGEKAGQLVMERQLQCAGRMFVTK